MRDPRDTTSEDIAVEREFERIAGRQEEGIAALKAAARAFKAAVLACDLPLGCPVSGLDTTDLAAFADDILGAPDAPDDAAVWDAAEEARRDHHDAVSDARREAREAV